MTIDFRIQLYYEALNFKFDFNFNPGFLLKLIQISIIVMFHRYMYIVDEK